MIRMARIWLSFSHMRTVEDTRPIAKISTEIWSDPVETSYEMATALLAFSVGLFSSAFSTAPTVEEAKHCRLGLLKMQKSCSSFDSATRGATAELLA